MIGMTAKTLNTLLEFVLVIYCSITASSKMHMPSFRTNRGFWANLMWIGNAYLDNIGSKKRYLCETSIQTTFDLYTLDHLISYKLYHRYTYFISASLEVAETPNPEKAFPIESPTSANVSDVFFTLKMFETTRYISSTFCSKII